ncbi:beta-propeller domain-containing protein [Nocardioides sp. 1609]|uniref:beta-propeller domain-containing protein n=1 Tax=Nocardioides sp. 1609 TaxID=2508327 RepID=UPI00106F1825|nr:beta-propeller domain-containing protein [Nocardioides sp. 1609]
MTDLERQWDDLPVGPAPVDAILREARREAAADARRRPERRLRRSLTGVAVIGGVAAAFVAGTLVVQQDPPGDVPRAGGPGGGSGAAPDLTPAAFHGELQEPASCADLLEHYVDEGLDRVTRWGWDGGYPYWGARDMASIPSPASEQSSKSLASYTSAAEATDTGTNVQEAGVDEPDHVKTDGEVLVRLRGSELTTYDVAGDEVAELGSLDLGDFHDGEILLTGDRVVAIGNDGTRGSTGYGGAYRYSYVEPASPQTRVLTVDLTDPAAPALEQTVDYDASLVAARQHGTDVRLVLSKGLPDLDLRRGGRALEVNRQAVEESTLDDWLPHVSVDGGEPTDLLDCARVAVPRAELGLATMAVVGFGADAPGEVESLGLAGDAPLTYESTDHLYLASSGSGLDGCWDLCPLVDSVGGSDGTTHVYDFALDGTGASYVGAGEVEGTVRDRWSMDEADGVLRLAVGPSSETGRWNSIVTMRAEGDALVEVGRIDRLGVDEDIKAVRWFDDLALLVTFRQVDPLYAVDLGDVTRPTLLGELKIPGFSTYLHPLGPRRFIGVGAGPQGPRGGSGAQAGLFDVTDITDPVRLDVTSFGRGTHARAGDDPRQFTWLPDQRIALTVLSRGRAGYVAKLQLGGGRMREELTRVEFGDDVAEVRLVPLPRGRVALVTGEDVAFLDLG